MVYTRDMIRIMLCYARRDVDHSVDIERPLQLMSGFTVLALKSGAKGWVWIVMDDLRAYGEPRLSRRAHLFQEDRSPLGPEFLLDYYTVEKKEREREREGVRDERAPPTYVRERERSAFSPLELQIYVPHGTRPGR